MRLSEAIRLGSLLRPKCRFGMFVRNGSCAIGAAIEACGKRDSYDKECVQFIDGWDVNLPFYQTMRAIVRHPGYRKTGKLGNIVACLNDEWGWTREQIADWVETQERALGLWEAPQDEIKDMEAVAMSKGGTT